ncbi:MULTISPECIES: branched-chain amino acid ABC transporter permease [Carboxydocella]|uniref:branched-chain amino acid ABC transporter permease n=1 Tax=Carboxydocella TaxID=178898 RepID=UPI000D31C72A|nr:MULTISPECIES: branched-chain amino acid ABC transporter permease [Carboxydocella]
MLEFLQQLINGISLGSIYALIALGYTMVYGIIRLINFAHGDIYMLGAFAGFLATTYLHLPLIPAILLAMLVCALIGVTIEKLAYKPLRHAPRIAVLITAIGVSFFIEYGTMYVATPQPRTYPAGLLSEHTYNLGGLVVNNQQIWILAISIVLMLALQWFVHSTKTGKAMRAVSHDTEAAALMGINVDNIISVTFAIGSALAAAAGVLVGIYYNSIDPLMGIMPGLKAFVSAVLGGIGSIPGAVIGGLLMGTTEAMVSGFFKSTYRDAVAFLILIVILLVKPSGIMGKHVREKV